MEREVGGRVAREKSRGGLGSLWWKVVCFVVARSIWLSDSKQIGNRPPAGYKLHNEVKS